MWHKFYWTNHMNLGTIHLGRFWTATPLLLVVFYYCLFANLAHLANFWPSPFKSYLCPLLTFLKIWRLFWHFFSFSSDFIESCRPQIDTILLRSFLNREFTVPYHIVDYTLKVMTVKDWNKSHKKRFLRYTMVVFSWYIWL